MIINGKQLLHMAPIKDMIDHKARAHGVSHGLAEVGVDIRIKQTVRFIPPNPMRFAEIIRRGATLSAGSEWEAMAAFSGYVEVDGEPKPGRFCLASAIEPFQMPNNLVAMIGHKSTWARQGVNVWAGTTAEPGWHGDLTLEIGFHGNEPVTIPAGAGIAQAIFFTLAETAGYDGKYQGQSGIQPAILEGGA